MKQNLQHHSIEKTWKNLSFIEQMANIGSEVERAINWKEKNKDKYSKKAFFRAIELFNLTLLEIKSLSRLTEVARSRELFSDFFWGDNQYNSTKESWQKYFKAFNYLARKN
jgi:hypothetical protein